MKHTDTKFTKKSECFEGQIDWRACHSYPCARCGFVVSPGNLVGRSSRSIPFRFLWIVFISTGQLLLQTTLRIEFGKELRRDRLVGSSGRGMQFEFSSGAERHHENADGHHREQN